MVPWTHVREPIWENVDERISEFTHFNLVIRLNKVKLSALLFITFFLRRPAPPALFVNLRKASSFAQERLTELSKLSFVSQRSRTAT